MPDEIEEKIDFNFMAEENTGVEEDRPPERTDPEAPAVKESSEEIEEIATGGNLKFHQGLTKKQCLEAQRRAGSPRGLDMAAFLKETGVASVVFDELFALKIKE